MIKQRWRVKGWKLEWKMRMRKHMAGQLDCTTSSASTYNNGIHCIHFSEHMTFNWLNRLASKPNCGLINSWGLDRTTSTLNSLNQQIVYESSSLDRMSGTAMIVGLKIIHTSSEYNTTGIFSNVYISYGNMSHFRRTLMLNRCTL